MFPRCLDVWVTHITPKPQHSQERSHTKQVVKEEGFPACFVKHDTTMWLNPATTQQSYHTDLTMKQRTDDLNSDSELKEEHSVYSSATRK